MKIIIPVLFTLFFVGCTDLDEKIYDRIPSEAYPEDDAQIAGISVGAYTYFQPLADDEGWWFLAQEVSSDEVIFLHAIPTGTMAESGVPWISTHGTITLKV